MFETIVLPILLGVANAAGVGMIVPQVVRLRRHGSAEGVSAVWIGVGLVMNLWWLAYALALALWGLVPVAVGGAALYATMALQMVRIVGPAVLIPVWRGHAVGLLPLGGLIGGGWAGAGLAIGLLYGAVFAPAVWTAVRSTSLAGVSVTTWVLAWVEAAIWLLYGSTTGDVALVVGGLGGAVMSAIILIRLAAVAASPRSWSTRSPWPRSTARRSAVLG